MTDSIRITGRVLFLCDDPAQIRTQLAGTDLSLRDALPLRDNISTDEITPVTVMLTYDDTLGRFPYVGFEARGERPIVQDDVRRAGFQVTVAGKRYGKGSSRESSPIAERAAGIRLIVAESFERIYQQNCDNIGILTTTDFSVLERIAAGEDIPIEVFLQGRDELTQKIIRAGGLMRLSKALSWPDSRAPAVSTEGKTLVEKIIARGVHPETPGIHTGAGVFLAAKWRFSHDYFTGMAAHFMHEAFGKPVSLARPEHIIAFNDHLVLAPQSVPHVRDGLLPGIANLVGAHRSFSRAYPIRVHGELADGSGSEGICHAVMTERYALPGEVVVGTDSHTPHSGALGCLAFGAGATDVANSWVTGYIRCKVPETVRVQIEGALPSGVTAKDVVLHLLRLEEVRSGGAIGAVFEYGGSAVRAMTVDERATLTNMVAELGGFTGIVEPDHKTVEFLKERRGIGFEIQDWMRSDEGAVYRNTIHVDATQLSPMLAKPGDPSNGLSVSALDGEVRVDIAYGGSCTGGKREDFDRYHEVLRWGLQHDMRVAPGVRLFLQFGTMDVKRYCEERGYLTTFAQAGAELIMPGCGACANCGPGQSTERSQITISAINRNFPGRSGPGQVWLASPPTVVASALAGHITSFEQLQKSS
jgi:3-isopropylmalate/(R)-2-methylmalate dehydratase large subunit